MLFRQVKFPENLSLGNLYLYSMPGLRTPLDLVLLECRKLNCAIICLAPMDEILRKAPDFADEVIGNNLPEITLHPIKDMDIPKDLNAFITSTKNTALQLKDYKNRVITCGMGIGRSSTYGAATLMHLGIPLEKSLKLLSKAGSYPETKQQELFLKKISGRINVNNIY